MGRTKVGLMSSVLIFISDKKQQVFCMYINIMLFHCTAIFRLKFVNKVTSVVRNLRVSDLSKVAQIIDVASEGKHRPKHTHAVSSLAH